ncbi:hypothetical protein C2G38_2227544 [Gigaspora rosea]|uniref:Uncharacterized protein n=1 Tax=Gigaspora rosea TaxID=44941 RepID=A0A397U564_9GLOM|nr:hypothetical protein C2G38_2227544 [Gigaspora rosea]
MAVAGTFLALLESTISVFISLIVLRFTVWLRIRLRLGGIVLGLEGLGMSC